MNEQHKKFLKIVGIVVLAFLVFGIWNIIFGSRVKKQIDSNRGVMVDDEMMMGVEGGMSAPMSVSQNVEKTMMMDDSYSADISDQVVSEEISQNKVIKNASLSLKIKKTEEAVAQISDIAKSKGGEVFSTNIVERVRGIKSGTVVVKVPVAQFENAVGEIKKIATQVVSEYTSGQDVTEQYTDLQAQLKNKQAEEQSFVKILDQSGKIDDVLAVTREISRVRGEIERLQGKIKFMDSQTDMSTITILLSEDIEVAPVGSGWRPGQVFKQSLQDLVKSFQNFIDNSIRFVIVGLPSLLLFVVIFLIFWKVIKKIAMKIQAYKK